MAPELMKGSGPESPYDFMRLLIKKGLTSEQANDVALSRGRWSVEEINGAIDRLNADAMLEARDA